MKSTWCTCIDSTRLTFCTLLTTHLWRVVFRGLLCGNASGQREPRKACKGCLLIFTCQKISPTMSLTVQNRSTHHTLALSIRVWLAGRKTFEWPQHGANMGTAVSMARTSYKIQIPISGYKVPDMRHRIYMAWSVVNHTAMTNMDFKKKRKAKIMNICQGQGWWKKQMCGLAEFTNQLNQHMMRIFVPYTCMLGLAGNSNVRYGELGATWCRHRGSISQGLVEARGKDVTGTNIKISWWCLGQGQIKILFSNVTWIWIWRIENLTSKAQAIIKWSRFLQHFSQLVV